jgi:hypothetical protein
MMIATPSHPPPIISVLLSSNANDSNTKKHFNSIRIKKEVENVQIPPTLLHTKIHHPIARILKPK